MKNLPLLFFAPLERFTAVINLLDYELVSCHGVLFCFWPVKISCWKNSGKNINGQKKTNGGCFLLAAGNENNSGPNKRERNGANKRAAEK